MQKVAGLQWNQWNSNFQAALLHHVSESRHPTLLLSTVKIHFILFQDERPTDHMLFSSIGTVNYNLPAAA
jgi:hypothetical protein